MLFLESFHGDVDGWFSGKRGRRSNGHVKAAVLGGGISPIMKCGRNGGMKDIEGTLTEEKFLEYCH